MEPWTDYLETVDRGLRSLLVTDQSGAQLEASEGFRLWVEMTGRVKHNGKSLYFAGNGGSAAVASHIAADACKNGEVRAWSFSDVAMLTAAGNDVGFDQIFALPLGRMANEGDLLVTISSSGNSPNVLQAISTARKLRVNIVTLSAMKSDNTSRARGDLNFYVPLSRYGWAESAHHIVLHYWLDQHLTLHGSGAI